MVSDLYDNVSEILIICRNGCAANKDDVIQKLVEIYAVGRTCIRTPEFFVVNPSDNVI